MSRDLTFRLASGHDVAGIVALVESAYRGEVSRQGWTTEADLLDGQRTDAEEVHALLTSAESCFLLAEQNGEVCGSLWLSAHGPLVHLGMFAVQPTLQAQALGRALLAQAEQVARTRWAATVMEMTVITQRVELIAWYERRGYSKTGEERPFPSGNPRFGVPLRDDLRFLVLRKALG